MTKKTSRREKGITLIALIVTIIVLLILAGVTINLAVNNQGIFNKAKTATSAYKNASENEQTGLDEADKEIEKYMPKEGTEGGSGSITYTDSSGDEHQLTTATPVGTKIGTTANISGKDGETGVNLDWYLFDVSDDGKTAYLVSTPTYWVPDTNSVVNGAYTPKLVESEDSSTNGMRQAIQKKEDDVYSYNSDSVSYRPSKDTFNYFTSINLDWAKNYQGVRTINNFSEWNENEQTACYLADADIFKGIKDQVNNAVGNLKGKIQTLVGGASLEQWCNAYNKQSITNSKITCEYSKSPNKNAGYDSPGYIYEINDVAAKSGWLSNEGTIVGNDIYGAAYNNRNPSSSDPSSSNPFYSEWWLVSPCSSNCNSGLYYVKGDSSCLEGTDSGQWNESYTWSERLSLFASVSL